MTTKDANTGKRTSIETFKNALDSSRGHFSNAGYIPCKDNE
jgi:hypothetical protein